MGANSIAVGGVRVQVGCSYLGQWLCEGTYTLCLYVFMQNLLYPVPIYTQPFTLGKSISQSESVPYLSLAEELQKFLKNPLQYKSIL